LKESVADSWISYLSNKLLVVANNQATLDGTVLSLPNLPDSIVRSWTNITIMKDNYSGTLSVFENSL